MYSRGFTGEGPLNDSAKWGIETWIFGAFDATSSALSTDPKIHDLEWLWKAWMVIFTSYFGSRAASFKRPLLSVDVSVCPSVCRQLWCQMSRELSDLESSCPIGTLQESALFVARRLVTSSMTSRDYDVILVTSEYSKSSHLQTRTRINYPCGPPKYKLKENVVL